MIRFYLHDKSPREKETYTIDWTKHMPESASLAGGAPTALSAIAGTVTVADGANNAGTNETSFTIAGGTSGEVPIVLVGVDLDDGTQLDAHCILGVR